LPGGHNGSSRKIAGRTRDQLWIGTLAKMPMHPTRLQVIQDLPCEFVLPRTKNLTSSGREGGHCYQPSVSSLMAEFRWWSALAGTEGNYS
jgi:hypothetical protein